MTVNEAEDAYRTYLNLIKGFLHLPFDMEILYCICFHRVGPTGQWSLNQIFEAYQAFL